MRAVAVVNAFVHLATDEVDFVGLDVPMTYLLA